MKLEDFAYIQYSKAGKKRIEAYYVFDTVKFHEYFKECNYKPVILSKKLNIHYQSLRKLLQENNLWKYVRTKNGKGSGINSKRHQLKNKQGYLYSDDINSYKITGNRSRRKLMHIDIMEKHLGRELTKNERVHHVDLDKTNNSINNLYLCKNNSEHTLLHYSLQKTAAQLVKSGGIIFYGQNGYDLPFGIVLSKKS